MKKAAIVTMILLLAVPALAAKDLTSTTQNLTYSLTRYDGDCTVGNQDPIASYYDEFILGYESYASSFVIDAPCVCTEGAAVRTVHWVLVLDETSAVNLTPMIYATVDDGNGCLIPDAVIATGDAVTISGAPELGAYDIELPLNDEVCLQPGQTYMMGFYVEDPGDFVGLPVDDTPTVCQGFNMWDVDWLDMVDYYGAGGDMLMWVDLDCCFNSVATEPTNWGSLKGLYR